MCADTPDYKDTLNLPRTEFPMRAGLPQREPAWLARWEEIGVYDRLREKPGRPVFCLHDGPPYANGHLHIGHALNKTIKDMIVRSHQMMGFDSRYIPGWDCHGLPIEWKVEEEYRKQGKNKDAVPINEFRAECRKFAEGWVEIQREEFKRLVITGSWDRPYVTMDFHAERVIAEEFMKFVMNGGLILGTMDGANVEIYEEVGDDNIFIFGARVEEIDSLRHKMETTSSEEYVPPQLKKVIQAIRAGTFG